LTDDVDVDVVTTNDGYIDVGNNRDGNSEDGLVCGGKHGNVADRVVAIASVEGNGVDDTDSDDDFDGENVEVCTGFLSSSL